QKTRSNIEQVINKITNSLKQNVATEMNQLKRTLLFLFPEDTYQERVINIIYFLIKYGPDFIHNLYEELPVDTKRHHLIYL
ncbi:MAG: bacillithiol biosynthesis BshC, partial [Aliifodinibius sp.]|nr:bacillithiol biosynthesis BshC [Fodinibius sp.]NIV14923.1 bacillithiol biosynthesis BshC [Fodinibius sp.]NIY28784.1 bacillithiol biosynthesis BshC [Fodinibius sp.]